jgi:DNA-binding transcriptional ArsR family regulator
MTPKPKRQNLKHAAGANAALYKALSHPLRYRILMVLGESEATPTEMAELLEEDFHRVCEQVRVLRDGKFIELVDQDRRRGGTQHVYRVSIRPMLDATEWELLPRLSRETSSVSILRIIIDELVASVASGSFDAHPRRALHRKPMIVDEQGFADADDAVLSYQARLGEIAAESNARLVAGDEEPIQVKAVTIVHKAAPPGTTG